MIERRFIEEHFPIKEVSAESSREKSIRHGHISTMHLWWARRPLAASRATLYAALIGAPSTEAEINAGKKDIAVLSQWENSLNQALIKKAQKTIWKYNEAIPRVLDPFGGGGSIPLEAMRLGCETYTSDYNPVANLIIKATIEYPFLRHTMDQMRQIDRSELAEDVKKWSQWVLKEVKQELVSFFPNEGDNEVVGYLWSRCIPCQNPRCGATVPLLKHFWLANTDKRQFMLVPIIRNKKVLFKIINTKEENKPHKFNPKNGTISRGKATCLVCNHRMDGHMVKSLFKQRKNTEQINVVILKNKRFSGKIYRIANSDNREIFNQAKDALIIKTQQFVEKYNVNPIPMEPTPEGKGSGAERAFSVKNYGMDKWSDLFNERQKLVLLTFAEKILDAADKITASDPNNQLAILTYLAIIFDRLVDKDSTLCTYSTKGEKIEHVFGRQALPMVWDYAEVNPFTSVGWPNMEQWVLRALDHLTSIVTAGTGTTKHASATQLPFDDEFFDAVATDPPYYDNVPYSYLSDYFYVWLRSILGARFPSLFTTPLTPKSDEIVVYSNKPGGKNAGKLFFKEMLAKSFEEIRRVLKPDGIAIIVYAHKSTDGWEALIDSLLHAGLVVTAAWPVHTEMKGRLRSKKSAALLSSIYMVCRKIERDAVGFYPDVRRDLRKYLDKKLDQLWREGISGADFFISSIGSAIEVYGKYDKVLDSKDNVVLVSRLLDDTRTAVTDYAIDKVIHGEFAAELSKMTRFYILWRWAHGEARVPFDEAHKLAQSIGINLENEWNSGFIVKDKEYIRVVGPDERGPHKLEESRELIDILHHALWLWRGPKSGESHRFLASKGYKDSEVLKRVAQAISETLSDDRNSTEKEWIDGMFTGKFGDSADPAQAKLL